MTNTNFPTSATKQPPKKSDSKNLIIGILALALIGSWAYLLINNKDKTAAIEEHKLEATNYLSQKDSLKLLYNEAEMRLDSITGANNNLQGETSTLQKEIEQKKAEIRRILNNKNASDSELKKARTLITDLNGRISSLEADVVRLNGENQQLTASNTVLTQEKETISQSLATTAAQKEALEQTVDIASTFSASNIQITPVKERKSGRETTTSTAKKVDKLVVSFDVENRIAKSGPADMFIIVTAPDGKIIADPSLGSGSLSTRTDGNRPFTTRVPLEYEQGVRKNLQFPIRQDKFLTGDYRIEIYHNGFKIGEGVRSLRKGGLFG